MSKMEFLCALEAEKLTKQAEAEVVPSSSLVKIRLS